MTVNYLFSLRSRSSYEKDTSIHWFEPLAQACLQLLIPLRQLSLTSIICFVNLNKRWKMNAVIFCKECCEMRWNIFFTAFSAFLTWICHKKSMLWIFVRTAVNFVVNFCKKCDEKRWINFLHRIHRNHRISPHSPHAPHKISPHSTHFLQNAPKNLDPGKSPITALAWDIILRSSITSRVAP